MLVTTYHSVIFRHTKLKIKLDVTDNNLYKTLQVNQKFKMAATDNLKRLYFSHFITY